MTFSIIDKIIPDSKLIEKHELFAQRCFITIMLFVFFASCISFIAKRVSVYNDPFPFWIIMLLVPIILYINKGLGNPLVAVQLFNSVLLVVMGYVVYETGGVFSINVKWFFVIIFFSVLFLKLSQIIFWFVGVLLMILANYAWVHVNVASLEGFDKNTYLIDNLIFIALISIFFIVFQRFQTLLRQDLDLQQRASEHKNVTLKLQAEKIEEVSRLLELSNQRLKDYAYTTSHDLRQPLRTIASFVELIEKDISENKVTKSTTEYMSFVVDAAKKGHKLVDKILEYAQVEHLENKQLELISTASLFENVTKSLNKQIEETGAEIKVGDLPSVYANPLEMERVFQNLISNALKYAKENIAPRLMVGCKADEVGYTFLIEDNGMGIRPENLTSIFDPFVQENRAGKFGQGIGLATCKEIIERHGGKIWAESELNKYTKLFFSIPKLTAYGVANLK